MAQKFLNGIISESNITLDDGSGASPGLILKNASNETWEIRNGTHGVLNFFEGSDLRVSFAQGGEAIFANNINVGTITTPADTNLSLSPNGSGHVYFGNSGNGMNLYHYSSANDGKYTTHDFNGDYYRLSTTATSGVKIDDPLDVVGALTANQFNARNIGNYITFYGNDSDDHSISSRNLSGAPADDLRFNSYGAMLFNLDSNSNNGSNADFIIGRHGGGTDDTISDILFTLSGETGNATFTGKITGTELEGTSLDINGNADISGDTTLVGDLLVTGKITQTGNVDREEWGRVYAASNTTIATLLTNDGSALPTGGGYRMTAHISGTGTDQVSVAVFWNQDGTWYCNNTFASGTSSNHIEFLISGGVPKIKTWHTNNYNITVTHERLALNETGTDNLRGYFGSDSFLKWTDSTDTLVVPGKITSTGYASSAAGFRMASGQSIDFVDSNIGYNSIKRDTTNGGLQINTGGTASLNILDNNNATFAGNVRLPNSGQLFLWNDHDSNFLRYNLWQASASAGMTIKNIANGGSLIFQTVSTTALTLDSSQNATFAGDIKQGTRIVLQDNGTIQWGAGADYGNLTWDTGYALIYGQSGKGIKFGTNGSTLALELDTSQNATFAGKVITTEVESASTLLLDAATDISLDAGGSDINLKVDGTNFGRFTKSGDNFHITATRQDGDIKFFGNDGGSSITALRLDMSDSGWAYFNAGINLGTIDRKSVV